MTVTVGNIFVFSCDWLKLKIILVFNDTAADWIGRTTTSGFRAGFVGLPSPSPTPTLHMMILFFLSHVDTFVKGGDCLWCLLVLWLFGPPPPHTHTHAKCRVWEDMQVARCLCNFPPAPFGRQARCNNNEPVLLLLNLAWLEIQKFSSWPKEPCYCVWARVRTARMNWPLA